MRRSLILTGLLIVSFLKGIQAQTTLTTFVAPDTVCIRQPITMYPKDTNASSYYWSFCSGYMMNRPTGALLGYTFGIVDAADIEIGKDADGNYYGFYVNRAVPEFVRLNFGNSLSNTPTFTNLGNLGATLTPEANSLFLMKDAVGRHVMFIVGGSNPTNSFIMRLDFGSSLANNPNCANLGNLGGLLNAPRGFFAAKEGPYWYGFAANAADAKLIRFDFGTNISNTPNAIDLGNPSGAFGDVSDMAAVRDNIGDWHVFATNFAASNIVHVGFGSSLAASPTASILPTDAANLFNPSSIIMAKECGVDYVFVTNATKNSLIRLAFSDLTTLTFNEENHDFVAGLKNTIAISHFIREQDNLYAFTVNQDASLGTIIFNNCTNSSLRNSTEKFPPKFQYNQPGRYSVFLSKNEGTPEASFECHVITALPIPALTMVDDTAICQGDTAHLWGIAFGTDTLRWTPNYNITRTETTDDFALYTKVTPDYTRYYHFIAVYPNGCIVDSPILVTVDKVKADAGIDRTIADGAKTVLGGPMSTEGSDFRYEWAPMNFLDNHLSANPTSTPYYDITYSLKVTNIKGCVDYDTVTVKVGCEDINLPNAFVPEDHSSNNDYFGILNKNIVKLNYFRIFDRWGKEVFSTTDISKKWNGQLDGVDCPYGVYVWSVDGFCVSGKRVSKSGTVTLIR